MKLSKAIELGKQYRRDGEPHDLSDFEDFIDLSLEAMEGIIAWRVDYDDNLLISLPGETEE